MARPTHETFIKVSDILLESSFSRNEILFIAYILSWQDNHKRCYANNATIQRKLGISHSGLVKLMKQLEDNGYLVRKTSRKQHPSGSWANKRVLSINTQVLNLELERQMDLLYADANLADEDGWIDVPNGEADIAEDYVVVDPVPDVQPNESEQLENSINDDDNDIEVFLQGVLQSSEIENHFMNADKQPNLNLTQQNAFDYFTQMRPKVYKYYKKDFEVFLNLSTKTREDVRLVEEQVEQLLKFLPDFMRLEFPTFKTAHERKNQKMVKFGYEV